MKNESIEQLLITPIKALYERNFIKLWEKLHGTSPFEVCDYEQYENIFILGIIKVNAEFLRQEKKSHKISQTQQKFLSFPLDSLYITIGLCLKNYSYHTILCYSMNDAMCRIEESYIKNILKVYLRYIGENSRIGDKAFKELMLPIYKKYRGMLYNENHGV